MLARSCLILCFAAFVPAAHAASPCWKSFGQQDMFGSTEQGNALKAVVDANPKCPIVGLVWSTDFSKRGGRGVQHSLLLWDEGAKSLIRLHVHKEVGVAWEVWKSVTSAAIKAEDTSDGFDFPGYSTGRGKAPFTSAGTSFVRANQSGNELTPGL